MFKLRLHSSANVWETFLDCIQQVVLPWKHQKDFKQSEGAKRSANNDGKEKLFVSHCWREFVTQEKKRRIVSHMSKPVKVRKLYFFSPRNVKTVSHIFAF